MNDIHTLAGAYVLDAVDDIERAAFARHLADCPSCAGEVAELLETAARLADGTWSVPPPRLRTDVLAQVSRTRQVRPGGGSGRDRRTAGSRWRTLSVAAVAAVVLAAGAGAVTWTVAQQRVRDERVATAAARAETERIRTVLAQPDLAVQRRGLSGGGRLTVFSSPGQDSGVALLADAPPIPADRAYQLWLMDGETARPANVLPAGVNGDTVVLTGVRGRSAVAVTVEPAGGSAQPSTSPLAIVPLT
ncbi:anti-sigma factor [Plantactinospora sp. S1510]|uniref:Regulator of SigK n=1 Tax=Plantactinospora alkalitolerans TaxID=2789879 RepID=A0ABS0GY00_9ACTN|nr:anti-sigma factor [Plantactinospora alkalitolerans]MBF9131088.1 anti-sigma factor [Plantactinospora alkalitolerans]